ncbi:malate synthase A [Crenobacter sp. SG2305]|uniref:malate synthase A n=1 Tax=Crenobacter oryzisoli TaxID=3056844 RepID=UPI0025AB1445|nr:malate synthase A [Crenobacter sp. SG2305]MDN0081499.1 malate synthase A [Crenobacter sp. SG2305]
MMTRPTYPAGIEIEGSITPEFAEILTPEAMEFISKLHRKFEPRRRELLQARITRQKALDSGKLPDFLPETAEIRNGDWKIAPLPKDLLDRRVEITGPVERKMMINALNSGAKIFMTDFEDANCPSWENQIQGQINVRDAYRKTISFTSPQGKEYKLNEQIATLLVRPRGWHLMEKHVKIDGDIVSGAIFDFALSFYHNIKHLVANGSATYYYLPKMESHLEARLWNDIFCFAQDELDIARGTIKGTVLIETILAAFEMEEILYELREHSAGLNAGRWDYIFSCIKKFKTNKDFCLADRAQIGMTVPFMRAYALLLLKTCHKRNAPAIGGMSALIPIKNDEAANEKALAGVRADKDRDAADGYDGGWVAHPGLVPVAMAAWDAVLGDKPNQIDKQRDDVNVSGADLLNFQPETPITETGLRMNINVGIQYLGAWISGSGAVPIHNLMEDAATAEISRAQIWQWIRSPKGVLNDGRKVTHELFAELAADEVAKLRDEYGSKWTKQYEDAAEMFKMLTTSDDFVEFLTLPGYEYLA